MQKRTLTNAKRISDYNKFLASMDETNTKSNILLNPKENKNITKKEEMNDYLDTLIKNLDFDFEKNDLSSRKLTGQIPNDNDNSKNNDPNEYIEFIKPSICSDKCCQPETFNNPKRIVKKQNKQNEPVVEIKEYINIDTEINNIDDLLKLIDTYKTDPSIKYNINMKALHNIKEPLEELQHMVGMKELKNNIVDQILYFVQELHKNVKQTGDFMHSVIYGPPGTGKTEIAKIMGKIYCKLGVLSTGVFYKVTRCDLIAGYLGQTALKTKDAIKAAMGGVLFIDEAYSLGSSDKRDSFAKECIDTLCEALSDNKADLMVIIAGYENELKECFFDYNQGLDSRFTWRFKTDEYSFEDLYQIFLKKVKEIGWIIDDNSGITSEWFKNNKDYFKFYGRDIETILAKTKIAHSKRVFCKPENEKKKLNLKDLENGFKIYLNNENVKKRKIDLESKRYLYNTLYS